MGRAIAAANAEADLIEIRVDYMRTPDLETLLGMAKKPVIVTNRRREEGGRFDGPEEIRLGILREAVDLGASFVDIESSSARSRSGPFDAAKKSGRPRTVLSFHDLRGTPSAAGLRELCRRMIRRGPDVVKIVTRAQGWEDNFRILSLLPYARVRNQEIVAFCLGEKGKMSRVFAPLMGAAWTYACREKNRSSAPGQLTIRELREVWESLR